MDIRIVTGNVACPSHHGVLRSSAFLRHNGVASSDQSEGRMWKRDETVTPRDAHRDLAAQAAAVDSRTGGKLELEEVCHHQG